QGSVNHGRCFETLIPAMKDVPVPLWICGEGNFMDQTKALIEAQGLTNRILLKQYIPPALLPAITRQAAFGLTLFTATGLNQYQSLANRFFDYMMAGIPQVCVDYPQYRAINDQYGFALLIPDTDTATIAAALNKLRTDTVLYERLSKKAREASCVLNWQQESKHLLQFYGAIQQHG
ncbi:MAG: glycosyltransferase family 4 protein, partial [Chitinophagaceae bacterium]|nr:glycosyltransferase family 4 protein [Chitinophagaceae bacterium]